MILVKKMTILKRMLLWLSAIAFVTFVTVVTIGWEVRETIRNNGLTRINTILLHKLEDIDMYAHQRLVALDNLKQLVYFSSQHHPIFERTFWDHSPQGLRDNLAAFARKNGFYDLFIIGLNGEIVYSVKQESDFHTNLKNGAYSKTELAQVFNAALNNEPPTISDFDYYVPSEDFAAFIAVPLVDKGKTIGVVAVQIDNKNIQNVINDYSELGKTGDIIATFRHNGRTMVAAPLRNSDIKAFNITDSLRVVPILDSLQGESGRCYMRGLSGKDAAMAWGYQDDFRMNIVATIDEDELLKTWDRQFSSILVLFLIGVLVVMSMLVIVFRSFARPIDRLTQYAMEISDGNYALSIMDEEYDREWQLLIRAFKKMVADINQKIAQLNRQNLILSKQKKEIEDLNLNLEERIRVKSRVLQEYVNTVDQYVITSRTDKYGNITYASEAFCRISGYLKEDLIGKNHRIIRHPEMPDELFEDMWRTISSGQIWHGEIKNFKSDGGYYWVDTTISPDILDGEIVGYTAVRHDITDKKIIEELAITDPMTGLYNRRFYVKTIHAEMNRIKRHGPSLALMMIDVDHFKSYNDTYGHQEGDNVLTRVADVLKEYTSRSGEYAFRLGGEEFGIVVSSMSQEEYVDLANRIRVEIEELAMPHQNNTASPYVTISIGIALYTSDSEITCEELYKEADRQLYIAKEQGRNRVVIRGA